MIAGGFKEAKQRDMAPDTSTESNSGSLKFDAYTSDPIANFVIRHGLARWKFGLIYIVASLILFAVSAILYEKSDGLGIDVLEGRDGLDIALLGGIDGIVAIVVAYVLISGFVAVFYLYISEKAGKIFNELAEKEVLDPNGPAKDKVIEPKSGSSQCAETAHNLARWPWLGLGVTIVISAFVFNSATIGARDIAAEYSILWVVILLPVWFQGIYMITMTVTRFLLTLWWLYKVFRVHDVKVHPLHPDRCGGLGNLRNYSLALSYMIAIYGVGLLLFTYNSVRAPDNCVAHFVSAGMDIDQIKLEGKELEKCKSDLVTKKIILDPSDSPGSTSFDADRLGDSYENFHFDLARVYTNPAFLIFYVAYFTLSPVAFFGTLGTAHGPMSKRKLALLQSLSDEFDNHYAGDQTDNPLDNPDNYQRLQRIRAMHLMTQGFQAWPWDPGSVRLFALVNGPFVAATATAIVIEIFFFNLG